MKLSKVKKVCMEAGQIIVKKADTGIDINTWIGTNNALYPVRGLSMNAEVAIKIWEIEQKKLMEFEILEDTEEDEARTLINREELESLDYLADTLTDKNKDEYPGLTRIARIDNKILMLDKKNNKAWVFRETKLAPIEGTNLMFIPVEEGRGLMAVYSDGILEAVIYAAAWNASDLMKETIRQIAEIYREKDEKK